jgi:ribosome maturation factor RimP
MVNEELYRQIEDVIRETNPDAYLTDIQLARGKHNVLSLRVNTDEGISLKECAKISRAVGKWLDTGEILDFSFNLEVSSPGVGEPLKLLRQYPQNIGRGLRVILKDGKELEGVLSLVEADYIELNPPVTKGKKKKKKKKEETEMPEIRRVPFEEIKESKVIISF